GDRHERSAGVVRDWWALSAARTAPIAAVTGCRDVVRSVRRARGGGRWAAPAVPAGAGRGRSAARSELGVDDARLFGNRSDGYSSTGILSGVVRGAASGGRRSGAIGGGHEPAAGGD